MAIEEGLNVNAAAPGTLPEGLQGIIITDCDDPNARARQETRFGSLFGFKPTFVELGAEDPDLEAAGHLVDALDATRTPAGYDQSPAVILVNVAPRGDDVRAKWENGTPFCHVDIAGNTVFSAYEGRALSLVHKLGLVENVSLLDIPTVTGSFAEAGVLTDDQAEVINNTQFRSLEFLPLAARELLGGRALPSEEFPLEEHPLAEGRAWFVDNFGNVKASILPEDIGFEEGQTVRAVSGQEVVCYRRLTDVPTGAFGLTVGSSGYGEHRWLELVQQRGRAADELDIKVGSKILDLAGPET